MIYLDYNATTPLDNRVFEAMTPYMTRNWGNPSSPYSFGNQARIAVEKARVSVAENLGCKPAEIIFTSCGTESDNLAVRGGVNALLHRGNHIVTTAIEHHAVLNTCKALEAEGRRITYLPVGSDGAVRIEDVDGESIVLGLDLRGIYVSTGSACSTGDPEPSHVLLAMGLSPKEAQGSIRISLGKDVREDYIDTVVDALTETVKRLLGISSVGSG